MSQPASVYSGWSEPQNDSYVIADEASTGSLSAVVADISVHQRSRSSVRSRASGSVGFATDDEEEHARSDDEEQMEIGDLDPMEYAQYMANIRAREDADGVPESI